MLALLEPATAIVCIDDPPANGTYWACLRFGWRIPEDISIVAFGGTTGAALTTPPLTTVIIDYADLGRRVADLLIRLVQGEPPGATPVPVRLVVRGSTAAPRGERSRRRLRRRMLARTLQGV